MYTKPGTLLSPKPANYFANHKQITDGAKLEYISNMIQTGAPSARAGGEGRFSILERLAERVPGYWFSVEGNLFMLNLLILIIHSIYWLQSNLVKLVESGHRVT